MGSKLTVQDGFSADSTGGTLRSHRTLGTPRPGRKLSIEMAIMTFLCRTSRETRVSNGLRPTRALAARPNRDLDVRGGTITLPCSGDNRGSLESLGKKVLVEL
jgi:hypothetical protein